MFKRLLCVLQIPKIPDYPYDIEVGFTKDGMIQPPSTPYPKPCPSPSTPTLLEEV